jgi:two-component system sensor histidine kinase GlrK
VKRYLESFTLLQLFLLGFGAVILPLALAIAIAVVQSEELAAHSRDALVSVQTSIDRSRQLAARVRELERSARQFLALDDSEILRLYQRHSAELHSLLDALHDVPRSVDASALLDDLAAAEAALSRRLPTQRQTAAERPAVEELEVYFARLRETSAELLALYSQRGRDLSNELPELASRQRSSLVALAAMVIPLSLVLAGSFIALARHPLRQLDGSIRALGDGKLDDEIAISGARDLVELGQRLDWLRTRLLALESQKTRFLRDVSHELKTPLTNIREASALLLEEPDRLQGEETATVVRILHENGLRLQSLIEELLRFGAADGSGGEHVPLALDELVSETVSRQALAARARRLQLETQLSTVCIRGNPRQLDIVVDNLLSNAIKYSPEGGQVEVRLTRCGSQAQLDVVDQGPGVDDEHREAIFGWFFRGDGNSKALVEGSGMGLAIASEYARLHAGSLQLLPSGRGAHFRLRLGVAGTEG